MRERTDKTVRGIFYGMWIAVLLGLSCVMGICIEREHQKKLEMQREYVDVIAVVNAEEFEATTHSMTSSVTALCDGWVSASTEAYREDYTAWNDTGMYQWTAKTACQLSGGRKSYFAW